MLGLSISHSPVFLLNSCLDLFSAPCFRRDPLFRSYGVNLPSSLTVNLSSALVCSTRPRVSVSGTGLDRLGFSGFSREHGYHRCRIAPQGAPYCPVSAPAVCLPRRVYLRGLTHYSVSARVCHFSVSASHLSRVRDFLPYVHRLRLAAPP